MTLADGWMIFLGLALTLYVVLDGYDLGLGVLTLFETDPEERRELHALVSWTWDGNESWLLLVALALWAGTPLATSVALPALYIPLIVMVFALIGRGFALELLDLADGWNPLWGAVFGIGSLMAAFSQGVAFGGLVAGVTVRDGTFAGGPWSFLHDGYAVLTGVTAVVLYVLAGCAFARGRAVDDRHGTVLRVGRICAPALAVLVVACWLLAPVAGTVHLDPAAAARLPLWVVGAVVLLGGLVVAGRAFASDRGIHRPTFAVLAVYAGGLLVLGGLLYPALVPPSVTVHDAASPRSSLLFLLIGVGIFVPVILVYQTYGYVVFRGRPPRRDRTATT